MNARFPSRLCPCGDRPVYAGARPVRGRAEGPKPKRSACPPTRRPSAPTGRIWVDRQIELWAKTRPSAKVTICIPARTREGALEEFNLPNTT